MPSLLHAFLILVQVLSLYLLPHSILPPQMAAPLPLLLAKHALLLSRLTLGGLLLLMCSVLKRLLQRLVSFIIPSLISFHLPSFPSAWAKREGNRTILPRSNDQCLTISSLQKILLKDMRHRRAHHRVMLLPISWPHIFPLVSSSEVN